MGQKELIAHYAEALKKRTGLPLPRQTATHLARVIGEVLSDGVPEENVEAGLDVLVEKGLSPGALPSAVIEAAVHRPSKGSYTCDQPDCGITFHTEARLWEHKSDVHWIDPPDPPLH